MNEALCSILCDQDTWSFDPDWLVFIKFNRDGTGELWYIGEQPTYICAVNLEWKSVPSPKPNPMAIPTAEAKNLRNADIQVLGILNLEITLKPSLAKSMPERCPHSRPGPYAPWFSDPAFRTRTFTVTLEKGRFIPDDMVGNECKLVRPRRWGLRLLFDKSPYPTREGLNMEGPGPGLSAQLDRMVMFVARQLSEEETAGKAMNDDSIMGYRTGCLVG